MILFFLSPLEALRADRATHPSPPEADAWLHLALLLTRETVDDAPRAAPVALYTLLDQLGAVDDGVTLYERLRRVLVAMEEQSHLRLATVTATAVLRQAEQLAMSPIECGRLHALRARFVRQLGCYEEAHALYREVERLGRQHRAEELVLRAYVGYGNRARFRGNWPEAARWFGIVARRAPATGDRELAHLGHDGCVAPSYVLGRHDAALHHAWASYRSARGTAIREASALGNIGELLLKTGHVVAAEWALHAALRRAAVPRLRLPTLGSLAHIAAMRGDGAACRAICADIAREARADVRPHDAASALVEAAEALLRIGAPDEASRFERRAEAIAERFALHEFSFRAEEIRRAVRDRAAHEVPVTLRSRGRFVIAELAQLDRIDATGGPYAVALR